MRRYGVLVALLVCTRRALVATLPCLAFIQNCDLLSHLRSVVSIANWHDALLRVNFASAAERLERHLVTP